MHLMPKCILAYIFQRKMFSTNKMWCKNIFLQSIKCFFAQLNILQSQMYALRCQNAFWHQMHFCIKCICNILCNKMYALPLFFAVLCFFTFCWTFSFGKCDAEHFPLENVMLCKNAFDAKMHFCNASHFVGAKMHLMLPLHFVYKMLESGKMHFGVHFTKENVQQSKMLQMHFCTAKKHFCIKYIFASNRFDAKMYLMLLCFLHSKKQRQCKNVFDAKMYLMQKCIWCKNVFDAKMYLMQKCIFAKQSKAKHHILLVLNIFLWKMWCWTFYKVKCDAEHFPLENVMLNIFLWKMYAKMHFCIKCIFAQLNIFLWKMYAKMHFAAF